MELTAVAIVGIVLTILLCLTCTRDSLVQFREHVHKKAMVFAQRMTKILPLARAAQDDLAGARVPGRDYLAPPNRIGPDHPRLTEDQILALKNPSLQELCRVLQSMGYQGYEEVDLPPEHATFEAIVREYVDRDTWLF